jgi:hypothetical protein
VELKYDRNRVLSAILVLRQPVLCCCGVQNFLYSIPPLFRYTLRLAVLLPLLLAGRTRGRPTTTLGMSCLQSHFASSSVVGGSEHVISYCAVEHGGRGVYLNKGGIEYNYVHLTSAQCQRSSKSSAGALFQSRLPIKKIKLHSSTAQVVNASH